MCASHDYNSVVTNRNKEKNNILVTLNGLNSRIREKKWSISKASVFSVPGTSRTKYMTIGMHSVYFGKSQCDFQYLQSSITKLDITNIFSYTLLEVRCG
jgi:hypothetical protein